MMEKSNSHLTWAFQHFRWVRCWLSMYTKAAGTFMNEDRTAGGGAPHQGALCAKTQTFDCFPPLYFFHVMAQSEHVTSKLRMWFVRHIGRTSTNAASHIIPTVLRPGVVSAVIRGGVRRSCNSHVCPFVCCRSYDAMILLFYREHGAL